MTQLDLLDHIAAKPLKPKGATFNEPRDGKRLQAQAVRVKAVMEDHLWHTLGGISELTRDPEASVSARLRDLRASGFRIDREFVSKGLWRYRMVA